MRFTGRQVTVMVVAVCGAAIFTPVAVYAATGTSINIVDPYSASSKARVMNGALLIRDNSGALTVDGSIYVKETATTWAATRFGMRNDGLSSSRFVMKRLGANLATTIGTLTMSHESGTGPVIVRLRSIQPATAGNCLVGGTTKQEIASFVLPEGDTRSITWAPAFRVARKTVETCVFAFVTGGSGGHGVSFTASGALY